MNWILRPSIQPSACRACLKTITRACPSGSSAIPINTPTRRTRSGCCAPAASGHPAAAPPSSVMNARPHLVGPAEQREREGKSERFHGLEVEDQLDFHCPLDRQFGWLLALKYPSGVDADYTVRVPKIDSVAHETARQGAFAPWVDRGYPVACRQYGELFALAVE